MEIVQKRSHEGEVNRAKYNASDPCLIASKSPLKRCLSLTIQSTRPFPSKVSEPDIVLTGHTKEGFGLSWNPHKQGHLLSSSEDKTGLPLEYWTGVKEKQRVVCRCDLQRAQCRRRGRGMAWTARLSFRICGR